MKPCTCSNMVVTKSRKRFGMIYQKRIPGPLLDRIDIHVEVPRVAYEKLSEERLGEPSAKVRERVEVARGIQRERFSESASQRGEGLTCNAEMRPAEVRRYCGLDETGQRLLGAAMNQMQLTARAYHRIPKLARTIADLAGSEAIGAQATARGGAARVASAFPRQRNV